jgi:YD repeat-containing protein
MSLERKQPLLNLQSGREYIFEGWVKIPDLLPTHTYPEQSYITISDGTNDFEALPVGPIIEGWQQIRCKFIPEDYATALTFEPVQDQIVYYDDIRLSPLSSGVKSYVYDADKLRLIAELDENNFATIYGYDDEGKLVLIRKETEKGIKTIQESRIHIQPKDIN